MARQARLDAEGTLHYVMVRGIERRRIVDDDRDRNNFVTRFGVIASETGMSIYAWALKKNHAHILLSSGVQGLSKFMRRLLTGYAVTYNIRHRRHGHLFQNRYKSIVCDGDSYFTELVRYIHLNPLRVKLVKDINELERYRYCGHGVVMGRHKASWQDREYVLGRFGHRDPKNPAGDHAPAAVWEPQAARGSRLAEEPHFGLDCIRQGALRQPAGRPNRPHCWARQLLTS